MFDDGEWWLGCAAVVFLALASLPLLQEHVGEPYTCTVPAEGALDDGEGSLKVR